MEREIFSPKQGFFCTKIGAGTAVQSNTVGAGTN